MRRSRRRAECHPVHPEKQADVSEPEQARVLANITASTTAHYVTSWTP
jgi:hypothetical protein